MPRPKERSTTVIRSFAMEKRLADRLEEEAHRRGVSVSKLVEEILMQALNINVFERSNGGSGQAVAGDPPSQAGAGDPPGIDPVVRADIEDFEEELARADSVLASIERDLERNPHLARPIANPLLQSIRQELMSRLLSVEGKLKELRSKYYSLKRVARSYEGMDKLATKLYDLRKRVRSIRKRLSGKASRG